MTKMDKVWFSSAEFRPRPDSAAGAIPLGYVLGFKTKDFAAVCTAIKGGLNQAVLRSVDPLSQLVIAGAADVLERSIREVLDGSNEPSIVLRKVANRNKTSLFVTKPQEFFVDLSQSVDSQSRQKIAEDYAFRFYNMLVEKAAHPGGTNDENVEITPVWMLPPKVFLMGHAR
jgi:hypothetical protein